MRKEREKKLSRANLEFFVINNFPRIQKCSEAIEKSSDSFSILLAQEKWERAKAAASVLLLASKKHKKES